MSKPFGESNATEGHAQRSLRSGSASIVARGINALVQVGSVLCLARLLTPEDYGLVGMVMAVTGFASVFVDLGTRDAIVQRAQISEGEASALFWITCAVGFVSTLLTAAAGPMIAAFYGEPRLTMVAVACSLTFFVSALSCQPYALMRRRMQFAELGLIEVGANVVGAAVAISMAVFGFGYWSLVARPIAGAALLTLGVWAFCRWVPSRPTFTRGVKEMLKFGLNLTGFTMTDFVGRSSDRVGLGYRTGAEALGYYQNARFVYDNLLDVLVIPVHAVAVASLSRLRDNGAELRRLWAKALSVLTFFAMPAFGLLAIVSTDLIPVILGERWRSAGVLLSVMAIRGIPQSVERTLGWLHVTAGRTDRWALWGVFAAAVHLVALLFALPFGAMGVCIAYVLCMFLLFIPAIDYAGRPLGIGAADVVNAVRPQLLGALGALGVAFLIRRWWLAGFGDLERVAILSTVYLSLYLILVVGVMRVTAPLQTLRSLLRQALPARAVQPV